MPGSRVERQSVVERQRRRRRRPAGCSRVRLMQAAAPFSYRHMPRLVFLLRRLSRANYEREMELLDLLCDRKRPGIDVGAKIGMYTYRIREHSSEVIAFEPIPMFNRILRAVFEGKRGRVEPYA